MRGLQIPDIARKGARTTLAVMTAAKERLRTKVFFPAVYQRYAKDGQRIIFPALHYWRVGQNFDSILLLNNSYSVMNPLCTGYARVKGRIYNADGRQIQKFDSEVEPFGTVVMRISNIVRCMGDGVLTATLFPPADFFEHRTASFDREEAHRTTAYMGYELGQNISYVHNIETAYIGDSLPANPLVQRILVPFHSPRAVFMPNLSLPLKGMQSMEIIAINSASRRRHLMIRVLVDGKVRAESHKRTMPFEVLALRFVPSPEDSGKSLRLATYLATGNAKPYFIVKYEGQEATFHHS